MVLSNKSYAKLILRWMVIYLFAVIMVGGLVTRIAEMVTGQAKMMIFNIIVPPTDSSSMLTFLAFNVNGLVVWAAIFFVLGCLVFVTWLFD